MFALKSREAPPLVLFSSHIYSQLSYYSIFYGSTGYLHYCNTEMKERRDGGCGSGRRRRREMIPPCEISRVRAIHREGCLHEEVPARSSISHEFPPGAMAPFALDVLPVPVVVAVVCSSEERRRCGGASGRRQRRVDDSPFTVGGSSCNPPPRLPSSGRRFREKSSIPRSLSIRRDRRAVACSRSQW